MTDHWEKQRLKGCQYCGEVKGCKVYIPYGNLCYTCRKNLTIIRKNKLGIPSVKRKT